MGWNALLQIGVYFSIVCSLVKPLGGYMARIYQGESLPLVGRLRVVEYAMYRWCGIDKDNDMSWQQYLWAMLACNGCGALWVYAVQRLQAYLPFNPQHLPSVGPWLAFNTAVSYVTNTNWQAYAGETTMSYATQMLAFTSQNFLSAATGMALLMAFSRGLSAEQRLGNYWVDMLRGILYILLPLSLALALFLVGQGVIQSLKANQPIQSLQNSTQAMLPMGPVASQIAIKQLGSNGGGFFNANAAHPFENPNPCSNFFEMLAILLIPAALTYSFGCMVNDRKQGWALLAAMLFLCVPFLYGGIFAEQHANPSLDALGIVGGNMEGKETRFGIVNSVLWTALTTATANGSVNSMLDSYTPIGGLVPLCLMQLGEVVFGGVGSGLYSMLLVVIMTVFIGGLMVGRTPEYLGKKIAAFEMKMACLALLVMPIMVLCATAFALLDPRGGQALSDPGNHGLTQALYAMTSMMNNNGSAFSGLDAQNPIYLVLGSVLMLCGRYWYAIPMLAIAGSMQGKQRVPPSSGTLSTETPLFGVLLIAVLLILGALSFLPVLALGPIVEQLQFWMQNRA